jgi:thiol-disulfide isomerase/thioredoxin/glutaredoxin
MRYVVLVTALVVLMVSASAAAEMAVTLPPFELTTLEGEMITDLDLRGPTLLFFTIPDCEACVEALRLLEAGLSQASGVSAALVVPDASEAVREMVGGHSIDWPVIVDDQFLLASVLAIGRVPTVCLLQDGELVGRLERGFTEQDLADALGDPFGSQEDLAEEAAAGSDDPMPNVAFMKLQKPLLLMFAGAECGYCHHMLPSVFEIAEMLDTCIVITEELVDPEPFESDAACLSIVLDPRWQLAYVFDVPTVPTIYFIDADGTVLWSHSGIVEGLGIVAAAVQQRAGQE